jgi:hypothetical protein
LGLAAVFWLLLAALPAVRLAGRAVDDVFITYRYAQNLAAGQGFVFNPGERAFGITEPAVGLVLGGLAWSSGIAIPILGTLFTAAALLALATGFLVEARGRNRLAEGLVLGTLLLATPLLWGTQGAAGPAVLALLLLAGRLAETRPLLAGVLCGVAVAFRPDALVGGAVLAAMLLLRMRRIPWRFGLAAGAVVALLALAAYGWFGAVIPQTLVAKQFHAARNPGSWIGLGSFWGFAIERSKEGPLGAAVPWTLLAGLLGATLFLRRGSLAERVVVVDGLLLALIYPLLRVPFFSWYAIPPLVSLLWGLAQILGASARAARQRDGARRWSLASVAAILALLVLAWLGGFVLFLRDARPDWRTVVYLEAGRWLHDHAAPDASLAFHEVGMLAFSSQRRVEDLLGLVTPRSLPYAREGDIVGAFLSRPTEYFVAHPFADGGAIRAITSRDWFREGYVEVVHFDHPELGGWISIFERRPGARLPPPQPPRPRRLPPDQTPGG